ncbi:MAG: hypothetical protein DYH03_06820 [Nitrospira sp. NTP1]|nr:hypothetical protein [Nitrospira sp. NTP1]
MTRYVSRSLIGMSLGLLLWSGTGLATEPADVEKFVNARIEIGEMMKLSDLLSKRGLSLEEYRVRSKEIFADKEAVDAFLAKHPDLKTRYDALPLSRMSGGGGSTGRGY